jgi:hypothetical protein
MKVTGTVTVQAPVTLQVMLEWRRLRPTDGADPWVAGPGRVHLTVNGQPLCDASDAAKDRLTRRGITVTTDDWDREPCLDCRKRLDGWGRNAEQERQATA